MVHAEKVKVQRNEIYCPSCPTCGKPLKQIWLMKNAKVRGVTTKCKFCGETVEITAE